MVAVGNLLFYTGDTSEGLAEEAFSSITVAMSVVIAFYFGAQAYQAVAGAKTDSEDTRATTETATPTEVWD